MTDNSKYILVTFNQLSDSDQSALATAVRQGDAESAKRVVYSVFEKEHPSYDPAQAGHIVVCVYPRAGHSLWFKIGDRIVFNDLNPQLGERVMAALDDLSPRKPRPVLATTAADITPGEFGWKTRAEYGAVEAD